MKNLALHGSAIELQTSRGFFITAGLCIYQSAIPAYKLVGRETPQHHVTRQALGIGLSAHPRRMIFISNEYVAYALFELTIVSWPTVVPIQMIPDPVLYILGEPFHIGVCHP